MLRLSRRSTITTSILLALAGICPAEAAEFGEYGKETLLELINTYPGRYSGTTTETQAADFMQSRMTFSGYNIDAQPFTFRATRGVLSGTDIDSKNIVVTKKGTGTGKTLYVGAHYDTSYSTGTFDRSMLQGLDDNSSGAAVLTELVRNMAGIRTEHDLTFIAFGAEEYGLVGSKKYVEGNIDATASKNAVGMINLDSLITGDFMYANAGDLSYDMATQRQVAYYGALRDHAIKLAQELGIKVKINQGDKPVPGTSSPYKPIGVGCCSDQESFDAAGIPVVGFEATNWDAGPDYDGYTQTENPAIPGGSTWHDPNEDNWSFLTSILGEEHVDQRMRDFSRLVTRLIVELTNADLLASAESGGRLVNKINDSMRITQQQMQGTLDRRYLTLSQTERAVGTTEFWSDAGYLYSPRSTDDYDPAQDIQRAQIGLFVDHQIASKTTLGGGLFYSYGRDEMKDDQGKVDSDGFLLSLYARYGQGAGWWGSVDASYGWLDLDASRRVKIGGGNIPVILNRTESGSTDGTLAGIRLLTGWNVENGKLTHGPYAGLDYVRVHVNGYNEDGKNRTSLTFKDQNNESIEAQIGYQLSANLEAAGIKWSPYARAAWVQELGDSRFDRVEVVSYADGGTRSVWLGDDDKSFARIAAGTQVGFTDNFGAYVEVGTRLGHTDGERLTVNAGLQLTF